MKAPLALALFALAAGASADLGVGDVAPPLAVKSWIGPATPALVKGRVTVLEFWAPWCTPCVAAFPHLNTLVETMKGEAVDFVSITDEPEPKVRLLLGTRLLRTHVALDRSGATFAAYGVSVIPHTVIVGPDGKIAAIVRPTDVTPEALRAVAAGKPAGVRNVVDLAADLEWDVKAGLAPETAISLAAVLPSPATSGATRPIRAAGRIVADGTGLMGLLKVAYGADFDTVRGDLPKISTPLRVSIKAPDGKYETAQSMLRDLLRQSFGLSASWEEVERTVPVLRRASAPFALVPSRATESTSEGMGGHLIGKRQSMVEFAQLLGLFTSGARALDETGLTERYDFDLEWIPGDRASLDRSLAGLGLELITAPRRVRELVVTKS